MPECRGGETTPAIIQASFLTIYRTQYGILSS
jgi:hypothetical protein